MKIKNLKINNYGNLENREIELQDNVNIIYGKNESGKSTLLSYIKNMLYGISKNKNGREISDYDKYKPWMRDDFSGKLKYELDNKKEFEIFRDFNKKNPKVFNNNLEDISSQFNVDKKEGLQFFFDQTKVDEPMFLSTVVSMQQEVKLDKQTQNVLVQKIANLAGTGNDNVSFKKVLDKLNKKQVDEIGTTRTQGKPINIVQNRIKEIESEKNELELFKVNKSNLDNEKERLSHKVERLNVENEIVSDLHRVYAENNIKEEQIKLKTKIKSDNIEKKEGLKVQISDLEREKKEKQDNEVVKQNNYKAIEKQGKKLKAKKKSSIIMLVAISIICLCVIIVNMLSIKNSILNIVIGSIILITFIAVFLKIKSDEGKIKKIEYEFNLNKKLEEEKLKNEVSIIDTKIADINTQMEQLQKEINKQEEEIRAERI